MEVHKPLPKQGIFWVINGEIISFADTVNPQDFIEFGAMNHKDAWWHIKTEHLVGGRVISYDYFPRGRVIVCPTFDDDCNIIGFDCGVYGDACIINDSNVREQIESVFDLHNTFCKVNYEGDYATDNTHYTCHNCRKHAASKSLERNY